MSIIVLLIFIAVITRKTNEDRRRSDLFKKIIMAYVGISVLAGLLSSGGFVPVAIIGALIWHYYNKKQKKEKTAGRRHMSGENTGRRTMKTGNRTARRISSRVSRDRIRRIRRATVVSRRRSLTPCPKWRAFC